MLEDVAGWPCCVAVYKYREYPAVRNLVKDAGIIVYVDTNRMLDNSIISLIKLMDGGPAMFMVVRMNHIIDIEGTKFISPLVKNILRVCVVS